ncbi:MAG: hypothetical protein WCK78_16610 [Paludibacter sp.]
MDKQQKIILFWVLTWAGLLLAVLYSPLGSPDLYSTRQFYIANKSVNFNGEPISYTNRIDYSNKINIKNNLRENNSSSSSGNAEIVVTNNYESASKRLPITNVSNSPSKIVSNTVNAVQTPINNQEANYSNSGNSGSGIGSEYYAYSSGRKSNRSNNNVISESDIAALTTNLNIPSITGNITTKQLNGTGLNDNTDPGGDPFGKPIPVGEGWIYMLVLVTAYGLWKFKIGKN